MKKQTKILIYVGLVALIIAIAGCVNGFASVDNILGGGALIATVPLVGAVVEGTTSVKELNDAGIIEQDIDEDIVKISPNKFPLDTILRNIRKSLKAVSQEVKYYQKSSKPMADKVNVSASGAGASAADAAKSYTYASGNGLTAIWVAVMTPKLWRVSDTVLMFDLTLPGVKGSATLGATGTHTDNVMFLITNKTASAIELTPIGGVKGLTVNADQWVVPNFTTDTVLVRMGQAKKETDLQTDPIAIVPESKVQYCQNFITQVEESTFSAMTKKEIETGINEFDRDNLESMRGEMEMSFLFGFKHKIEGANGESIYTTGGITREITKEITYGKGGADRTMTAEMYMNMLQEVFVGTSGSAERVLFGGSELIKAFELLREAQKNINGSSVQETYHGVIVTKLVSTFGVIRLAHDPALDEIGQKDMGIILDMAYIARRPFIPMVAKELDLTSSGLKNAKARTVQECSCVTLKYPDCHAIVRPKA